MTLVLYSMKPDGTAQMVKVPGLLKREELFYSRQLKFCDYRISQINYQ